jgi:hypothetical protein
VVWRTIEVLDGSNVAITHYTFDGYGNVVAVTESR